MYFALSQFSVATVWIFMNHIVYDFG